MYLTKCLNNGTLVY